MSVRSNIDLTERNGGIILGSQDGLLVLHSTSGTFNNGGAGDHPGAVRAEVEVRLADPFNAIPFNLLPIFGRFSVLADTIADVLQKIDTLKTFLETTAAVLGFPDLNLSPGEVFPVLEVKYFIDTNVPITVPIVPNSGKTHFMGLMIQAQASSAPIGTGSSDYSNTLEVKSVTVDPAYEGDPSEIVVTFESGKTFHATRESSRRRAVRH
jgi:hypothetical protein